MARTGMHIKYLLLTQVAREIGDLLGVGGLEGLELVLGPGGQDDVGGGAEQMLGDGEAEAAACAGDDDDLGRHFEFCAGDVEKGVWCV